MAAIESERETWARAIGLRRWQSLASSGFDVREVAHNLYAFAGQGYLVTSSLGPDLQEGAEDAPFVTAVLWAPSPAAAKRCALYAIEEDDSSSALPPEQLLPPGTDASYASIKRNCAQPRLEHAEYRIGSSGGGEFVHTVLQCGKTAYLFRSNRVRAKDRPYAIRIALA